MFNPKQAQAFWDSLVDDLRLDLPCYVRLLRVLAEVRDGISDLSSAQDIREVLDTDLIRQQADAGAFRWPECVALVQNTVAIIQRVQAPRRDDETKAKWAAVLEGLRSAAGKSEQARAFCVAIEFLLERVNAMRIDACNARLRLISPVIRNHGVDYERGKFQQQLDDGSLTLERTEKCVRERLQAAVAGGALQLEDMQAVCLLFCIACIIPYYNA